MTIHWNIKIETVLNQEPILLLIIISICTYVDTM